MEKRWTAMAPTMAHTSRKDATPGEPPNADCGRCQDVPHRDGSPVRGHGDVPRVEIYFHTPSITLMGLRKIDFQLLEGHTQNCLSENKLRLFLRKITFLNFELQTSN